MDNQSTVMQLLELFQQFRQDPTPIDQYELVGRPKLMDSLMDRVARQQTVKFVMLGFPFKSINSRDKVLGKTPDQAEKATIDNFTRFGDLFKSIYAPGVEISIVSDGYVFNDILWTGDDVVAQYKEESMDMARHAPIKWYDLNDFYNGNSLAAKRDSVVDQFGITGDELEKSILFNPDVNMLYRGMLKFMEEELAIKSYPSRNQLHKDAKKVAREMMFRNEAYSNLVRNEFSDCIRLSMHPSVNNGTKYSFQLIPSKEARHSAWHSALVIKSDGTMATMHRKDAEAMGLELGYIAGRPFYYKS